MCTKRVLGENAHAKGINSIAEIQKNVGINEETTTPNMSQQNCFYCMTTHSRKKCECIGHLDMLSPFELGMEFYNTRISNLGKQIDKLNKDSYYWSQIAKFEPENRTYAVGNWDECCKQIQILLPQKLKLQDEKESFTKNFQSYHGLDRSDSETV